MTKRFTLLAIDAQNDFCDIPDSELPTRGQSGNVMYRPALPVSGAHRDMQRLAEFVRRAGDRIEGIVATLDSHNHVGIERVTFWMDSTGAELAPYTMVTAADVRSGKYLPRRVELTSKVLSYLEALEASPGRHVHMVWPVHCEIGTWGAALHDDIRGAFNDWERRHFSIVAKVTKGSNPFVEHFSIFRAEVQDPLDPSTQLNTGLIARLDQTDHILIAGEAGSHCVKRSLEDLLANLPSSNLAKVIVLTDCISPVAGFESTWSQFLADISSQGVALCSSTDLIPRMI